MKIGHALLAGRAARARSNGSKGVALAVLATAQQLGGSVGLAVLVGLLSERVVVLGGTGAGRAAQSPGILPGALHVTFAAQAGIALLGAAVALLVIGRAPRPQGRRAAQDTREADRDPGTRAAA